MDPELLSRQHRVLAQAVQKGITLFASAGDLGSAQPTCDGKSVFKIASTPASDPNVTAVGGTNLTADAASGAYHSESVWNDEFGAGGGGFSTIYERPGYQSGAQHLTVCRRHHCQGRINRDSQQLDHARRQCLPRSQPF